MNGFTIEYDGAEGTVNVNDFGVREIIEVRKSMLDKAVLFAAIVELEKLGYTVIAPEGSDV